MEFLAIGVSKYKDTKDSFRIFKADSFNDARHYIINKFDCSLDWSYIEKPNNIEIIINKDWHIYIFILLFNYILNTLESKNANKFI